MILNMIHKWAGNIYRLIILLILFVALTRCTVDDFSSPGQVFPPVDETSFNFVLRVPGLITPVTRDGSTKTDEQISSIDLLVFDDQFKYVSHQSADLKGSMTANTIQFAVPRSSIDKDTDYNIVAIANASSIISTAIGGSGGTGFNGKTKEEVLDLLEAKISDADITAGKHWDVSANPIPMVGELSDDTGEIVVKLNAWISNSKEIVIDLYRMLARIDVSVPGKTDDFKLAGVYFCNYNTAGYLAPGLSTESGKENTLLFAQTDILHIPTNAGKQATMSNAILYNEIEADSCLKKPIYTFETKAATDSVISGGKQIENIDDPVRRDAVCLLVEGEYKSKTYYYRIDFTYDETGKTGQDVRYMPLVRNYHYDVLIDEINGIGYDTPEDALKSYTVYSNLKYRIHYYDAGEVQDFVFNGQYYLGVNEVKGTHKGELVETKVITNYSGFQIDTEKGTNGVEYPAGNGSGWIQSAPTIDATNSLLKVQLIEDLTLVTERYAYVYLKAGRLRHKVKVIQMPIVLSASMPFDAEFYDAGTLTAIVTTDCANGWQIDTSKGTDGITYSGTQSGWITPLNGSSLETSNLLNLKLTTNMELQGRTASIYLKAGAQTCELKVTQKGCDLRGESNCYMVRNTTPKPFMIPVSQVNRAMTSDYLGTDWLDPAATNLKVQVYWSDVNDFGAATSVVQEISYISGSKNFTDATNPPRIFVKPGSGMGNAVIILYEDNDDNNIYNSDDVIKWSWHVWNSGYYPYGNNGVTIGEGTDNKWMDRNLGAMAANPIMTDDKFYATVGLYYQWGRKDPMPRGVGTNVLKTMYTDTGTTMTLTANNLANNHTDFGNSRPTFYKVMTSNPTTYYAGSVYTSTNTCPPADAWGYTSGVKTVFDPCPEGWKVPARTEWTSASWTAHSGSQGMENPNYGGYYPYAGYMTSATALASCGANTNSFYWTSQQSTVANAYRLQIRSFSNSAVASKIQAYNIRCVKN